MNARIAIVVGCLLYVPVSSVGDPPVSGRIGGPEVLSAEAIDVSPYNAQIAAAVKAGEAWPRLPVQVAWRRVEIESELPRLFKFEMQVMDSFIENPAHLKITALCEGLLDDSINGEWISMQLEKSDL